MQKRIADLLGPFPWTLHQRLTYFRLVMLEVFWYSDTTTVRLILAVSSFGYCMGFWLPLHTLQRAPWTTLAAYGNSFTWGLAFMAHFVGVMWRILDTKSSVLWALAVNVWGLFIWAITTVLILITVGEYSPGMAMEITVIVAALVALIRTDLNREIASP